jgi:hypothetical protein
MNVVENEMVEARAPVTRIKRDDKATDKHRPLYWFDALQNTFPAVAPKLRLSLRNA